MNNLYANTILLSFNLNIMNLIPVIDLKDGLVVHAKRGLRNSYQALQPNANVFFVIEKLLALYDFKVMYIADLNCIMQQGDNFALINRIIEQYPEIMFWIDCGQIMPFKHSNYLPVLGSEWCSIDTLKNTECFILSLDFSATNHALGDEELFNNTNLWSKQVIIMTLARVGSDLGVDIEKLKTYCDTYSNTEFVAAGGVRDLKDLQLLKSLGIEYVLLASALHAGTISKTDVLSLANTHF